jgi:hypothetical protein
MIFSNSLLFSEGSAVKRLAEVNFFARSLHTFALAFEGKLSSRTGSGINN